MRFGKLKINNFMSYQDAFIDLSHEGLFMVEGDVVGSKSFDSNGAGKSTLFEAMVWCLFGKTIKGTDNTEIPNNVTGRNCRVSLEVLDGKDKYKIIR